MTPVLLLGLLLAAPVGTAATPGGASPPSRWLAVVEGTVREEEAREPIAEAWVEILDDEGRVRVRTLTDEEGRFRLQLPGSGSWTVRISRSGFEYSVTGPLELEEGETRALEILLRKRPA